MPLIEPYWVPVINSDSDVVPPFGVMMPDGGGINQSGQLSIRKPSKAGSTLVFFNGPSPIPPGQSGQGHQTFPAIAAYNQSTTPVKGDTWGTAAGSWYLTKGFPGWTVLDAAGGLANITIDTGGLATSALDINCYYSNARLFTGIDRHTCYPPGQLSGNWPTTFTPVANTVYAFPIGPFPLGLNVSQLGIYVQTPGSAGSKARVGLYGPVEIDPGRRSTAGYGIEGLQLDTGDIVCDSTNITTARYTILGTPFPDWVGIGSNASIGDYLVVLTGGIYWILVQFNSVATQPVILGASTDHMKPYLGLDEEYPASGLPQVTWGGSAPQTYGAFSLVDPLAPSSGTFTRIQGSVVVPIPYLAADAT